MSTSRTSGMATIEGTTHIVAGVHQFSDEGKNEVIRRFEYGTLCSTGLPLPNVALRESMAPTEVSCEYANNRFIIKSDPEHSEEVFSTFIRLIQEYIKGEVAEMEKEDYNEAPKISRLEGTYMEALSNESDYGYEGNNVDDLSERDEDDDHHGDPRSGARFTEMWQVGVRMEKPIPSSILNALKEVAIGFCKFEMVDEAIKISGDNKDSIHCMISVLDGVRSMMSQQTQSPVMFDFHIAEGEINYLLELKILPKAPDQRLKRTIVPPAPPYAKNLHEWLVLLMFKPTGNPATRAKVGAQVNRPFATKSQLWYEHPMITRGDKGLIDTFVILESASVAPTDDETPTPNPVPLKAPNPVTLWVEQSAAVAADVLSDPFAAPGEEGEVRQPSPPAPHQDMPRRHAKIRKPRGANLECQQETIPDTARTPSNSTTIESALPTPNMSMESPRGSISEDRLSKKSDPLERSSAASRSQRKAASLRTIASRVLPYHLRPPEILPPIMPRANQLLDDTEDDFRGPHAWQHPPVHATRLGQLVAPAQTVREAHVPLLDVSVPGKNLAVLQAQASDDLSLYDRHGLSQLDMIVKPTTDQASNHDPTHHHQALDSDDYDLLLDYDAARGQQNHVEYANHLSASGENLIDLAFDEPRPLLITVEENLQSDGEVESRRLRSTMSQQKGPLPSGPLGRRAETLQKYNDCIMNILEPVKAFPGIVKLRVNIGRLLIDGSSLPAELKRRPFAKEDWERTFSGVTEEDRHNTKLMHALTTSAADVEFLLNLSLPSSRRLFQKDVSERKVIFVFVCRSKAGIELLIEVEEGGKFQLRSAQRLVGALNWHFPKRMWDARLAVTTSFCNYFDDNHFTSAKAIVDSLCILPSKDHNTLDIYTRSNNPAFKIRSILLRRDTCHSSKLYPDLFLTLTELQELYVNKPTGLKRDYHAYTRSAEEMVRDGNRLWWEASLSSITANKTLDLNTTIKFGDAANWKVDDIIGKGVVKELSDLATELVTRIDSVGLHNSRGKTREDISTQDGTSVGMAAANIDFW